MGRLLFAHGVRLDLDDRALAHLHMVMQSKLRRGESFHLSWVDDVSIGTGRTVVWVNPDTSMVCTLARPVEKFDRDWLEQLMVLANSVGGLSPVPAPAPEQELVTAGRGEGSRGQV